MSSGSAGPIEPAPEHRTDVDTGFSGVDDQPDPSVLVNSMLATAEWPAVRQLRAWEWDHLAPRPGERALDVGCGVGDVATELALAVGPTGEVVGLDASGSMLGAARRRAGELGVDVEFRVGDATAIDLPDASMDLVRSERVLQWIPEPAAAIAEMVRVLRPGGRLVVIDSDWRTLASDVGDDIAFEALATAMMEVRGEPAAVGRRLLNLVRGSGLSGVDVAAATHVWTEWDLDAPPGANGLFPLAETVDQLVTSGRLSHDLGQRLITAVRDANAQRRIYISLGMVAVAGRRG